MSGSSTEIVQARRDVLRDTVCIGTLIEASDLRFEGDDAEHMLAESVLVLASNVWRACWDADTGTFPSEVLQASGQLAALARARLLLIEAGLNAPDDQHAFLIDQVGWLSSLAIGVLTQFEAILNPIEAPHEIAA